MLRTAALLFSGNAIAAILLLVRNLAVARLIPVADYGIAATFAIVMAVFEMASELGLQKQIVQARQGDESRFQAVLQCFQLLRGALTGLVFLLLAGPAALFMGVPEVTWAYRILAVIPVLRALTHFDIWRMNRQMRFRPLILTNTVPPLIGLLLLWPLDRLFGDWQIMLWAILAQVGLSTLISHLVAERPYRLAFDRQIIVGSLRFGWPVMINGVLLFCVFNGDRIIVGRELGMVALGIFALGYTLTLPPALVLVSSGQSLFLPRLAAAARGGPSSRTDFERLARANFETHLMFGIVLVLFAALLGGPVVDLLLGPDYAGLKLFLVLLAIQQALRVTKSSPATIALAQGQTANAMAGNVVRVAALPLAWLLAERTGSVLPVIWVGIAAEGLGLAIALALVRLRLRISLRPLLVPGFVTGLVLVVAGLQIHPATDILAVVLAALSFATMPNLRRLLWRKS